MSGERYMEMCEFHPGNELLPGKYNVYDADLQGNKLSEVPIQRGVRACVNCLNTAYYLHVPVVAAMPSKRFDGEVVNYIPGIEKSQTRGDKLNN